MSSPTEKEKRKRKWRLWNIANGKLDRKWQNEKTERLHSWHQANKFILWGHKSVSPNVNRESTTCACNETAASAHSVGTWSKWIAVQRNTPTGADLESMLFLIHLSSLFSLFNTLVLETLNTVLLSTYSTAADPMWCSPVQSCINGNYPHRACHLQKIPCLTLFCECTFRKTDIHNFTEDSSIRFDTFIPVYINCTLNTTFCTTNYFSYSIQNRNAKWIQTRIYSICTSVHHKISFSCLAAIALSTVMS